MDTKELRPYQRKIVEQVLSGREDLLICLPTGAGKTVIASELMRVFEERGLDSLFIVPRLELIQQAKDEFGEVDVIWSNQTSLTGKHKIIASKDSLRNQKNKLKSDNLILIFDEAHIGIEQTCELVKMIPHIRVLGLTATPERMDGLGLLKGRGSHQKFGVFDKLLQTETVASLIDKGFLSHLKYYARPIQGITEVKTQSVSEELDDKQIIKIFDKNSIWGDIVSSYEKYGKGRPSIGFTYTVKMAERVAKMFQEKGYKFYAISGNMGVKERQKLISDLASHKIDGLVNAALLTYGFDCPPVSYAFSIRHIKSRPLWFQMVGRILRSHPDKDNTIFVDHGDSISEFMEPHCSLPILDRNLKWQVDGLTQEEKEERRKTLKRLHEELNLVQELKGEGELVEITNESTSWDNLIQVLYEVRKENQSLKDECSRLAVVIQKLNEDNPLKKENKNLRFNNDILTKRTKELQSRITDLEAEIKAREVFTREVSKPNQEPRHFVEATNDKTFEFVRQNYWKARKVVRPMVSSITSEVEKMSEEHSLAEKFLRSRAKSEGIKLDEKTFESSMQWWRKNYTPRKGDVLVNE